MRKLDEAGFSYIEILFTVTILALIIRGTLLVFGGHFKPIKLQEEAWRMMSIVQSVQQECIYGHKFLSRKRPVLELNKKHYRIRRNGVNNTIDKWSSFSENIYNTWMSTNIIKFDPNGSPLGNLRLTLYDDETKDAITLIIAESTGRITISR